MDFKDIKMDIKVIETDPNKKLLMNWTVEQLLGVDVRDEENKEIINLHDLKVGQKIYTDGLFGDIQESIVTEVDYEKGEGYSEWGDKDYGNAFCLKHGADIRKAWVCTFFYNKKCLNLIDIKE